MIQMNQYRDHWHRKLKEKDEEISNLQKDIDKLGEALNTKDEEMESYEEQA